LLVYIHIIAICYVCTQSFYMLVWLFMCILQPKHEISCTYSVMWLCVISVLTTVFLYN
jgi:hypothetical protein